MARPPSGAQQMRHCLPRCARRRLHHCCPVDPNNGRQANGGDGEQEEEGGREMRR